MTQKPKVVYFDNYRLILHGKNITIEDKGELDLLSVQQWETLFSSKKMGRIYSTIFELINKIEKMHPESFIESENYITIDLDNKLQKSTDEDDDCVDDFLDEEDNEDLHPLCQKRGECHNYYYGIGTCNVKCEKLKEETFKGYLKRLRQKYFKKQIFLGSGDHSKRDIDILKKKLDDGLEFLCGAQQETHVKENDDVMQVIAKDIVMALTGKEIEFK